MSKIIIVGGVAGGATTAARLRRKCQASDEPVEIVMLEKGDYISYANCGLPYYIGGVIKGRDSLLLQTPQAMKAKFDVDVRTASEVTAIHPEKKSVGVRNLKTGESYEETYDKLVLATGSSPLKPPIPGIDTDGIFTLWSVPDTDRIKAYIQEKQPKTAAVVGGGFIGLEMAENLNRAGIQVSVIEMMNQVMAPLDYEMAQLLHENMRDNGVELILGDGVDRFLPEGGGIGIQLKSGRKVTADMVLLSIGVRPNSGLARDAGLTLNSRGGIVVNEYLQTSDKDIYAVGDVIEVENFTLKNKTMVPLAGPANRQGRICADNLLADEKERKPYRGSQGTSVAQVFDLAAAAVGVNEKTLAAGGKVKNQDYYTALIQQKSHAGYYPGATPLALKLLFDGNGAIFGAQAVGQEGVDKQIDVLAGVMRLGGTVYDLMELELSYAPPFSSAKSPINMLGFVAENILTGMARFIEWQELDALLAGGGEDYTVLDVTEEVERMVFSIPGSYHIPLGQLRGRLNELDQNKLIIPYCAIGVRSYNAARILAQNGFTRVRILAGGTSFYKSMHYDAAGQPAVRKEESQEEESGLQAAGKVKEVKLLDCSGLQCPGPIMKVYEAVGAMEEGETLKVSATDMGFARDIDAWCRRTGNTLLKTERIGKENIVYLQKGMKGCPLENTKTEAPARPEGKTLIVFSGDLDKVLASFIIANGAASMGRPVTMFFTFWGLNALRKTQKVPVRKSVVEKMFGAMMPRGSKKLKLSKMNMGGMGTRMMKMVMKDKNVDSLEDLMKQAMKNGVKLVACTMSMDIMGITEEELIDGVELAGVASYLGDAEESNVNLFI